MAAAERLGLRNLLSSIGEWVGLDEAFATTSDLAENLGEIASVVTANFLATSLDPEAGVLGIVEPDLGCLEWQIEEESVFCSNRLGSRSLAACVEFELPEIVAFLDRPVHIHEQQRNDLIRHVSRIELQREYRGLIGRADGHAGLAAGKFSLDHVPVSNITFGLFRGRGLTVRDQRNRGQGKYDTRQRRLAYHLANGSRSGLN